MDVLTSKKEGEERRLSVDPTEWRRGKRPRAFEKSILVEPVGGQRVRLFYKRKGGAF